MKGSFIIGNAREFGVKKENAVRNSLYSKAVINKEAKLNVSETKITTTTRLYYCQCCGKSYTKQKGNFVYTQSPIFKGNNNYNNICKNCVDKIFEYYTTFYCGNEEKAIDRLCQLNDWIFDEETVASSKKISSDRSRISTYVSRLNLSQVTARGTTYSDTLRIRSEEENEEIISTLEEAKDIKDIKLSQKTIKNWGFGFSIEQYKYLQEQYEDWTARHECKTKVQEELFKNLCIAQLNIQIAQQTGVKVVEAMKSFQDLLGSANLKPTQTNDNALADQNTFGTLIKKWENEKPISEPNEEWKDVDGIVKYITTYFLGHLCKMMNIKNSYSRMYEQEMAKFKVEKPEYEDDDEALFDAVFSCGDNDDNE
jgi:hypothetical protein